MANPKTRRTQWSWISVDIANSAFATTVLAAIFPQYLPSILPEGGVELSVFGVQWTSSAISIWGYTVSLSILITLILSLVFGAWADEVGRRKLALGIFTFIGAVATACLGFLESWQLVLVAFVFANIGFAAGNVFYNSLLPTVADEKDWDRLSLKGFAWGYISGGLMLLVNLAMILKYEWFGFASKVEGTRMCFVLVGLWWLVFTLPALKNIIEIPAAAHAVGSGIQRRILRLFKTFAELPAKPALLLFIIAFAFFNDGIQTVISMSSIFGKEILSLSTESIIGAFLVIQLLGWPLTLIMISIAHKIGAKRLLSLNLMVWIGIVIYAYFMTSTQDFYILGILVACVLGASQALARSIYARLIPTGRQAEYFSLYAFSGKASSIFGPLIFALVKDATGEARLAIISLAAFFIIGLLFLQFVSIDRPKAVQVQ